MTEILFIGALYDAFAELFSDIINLNPVLLQLVIFSLLIGGIYGLAALGLNLIFGVMEVVNFAHGVMIGVGMYTLWWIASTFGINPFFALPIVIVVSFVVGALVNVLTIEPIIDEPEENQFIVTFGVTFILLAVFQIVFSPNPLTLNAEFGRAEIYGAFIPFGQLYALIISIVTMAAAWAFLRYTELGLAIRGTANNRDGAKYVGINVANIDHITFGIGAVLAGVAGAAIAMIQTIDPFILETYLVYSFVIVILGGLGSFPGSFVGAIIIGTVQVFGGFYLPGTTFQVAIFSIFLLALYLKPEGLFGGEVQS